MSDVSKRTQTKRKRTQTNEEIKHVTNGFQEMQQSNEKETREIR